MKRPSQYNLKYCASRKIQREILSFIQGLLILAWRFFSGLKKAGVLGETSSPNSIVNIIESSSVARESIPTQMPEFL